MKRIITAFTALLTFTVMSCKKEKVDQTPLAKVVLTTESGTPQNVQPGPNKVLGMYNLVIENVSDPRIGFDVIFGGSIDFSKMTNFRFLIKQGNVLVDSTEGVDPDYNLSYDWRRFPPGSYTITPCVDVLPNTRGTVFVNTQIEWKSADGNDHGWTSEAETPPMTVFPYIAVPKITWHQLQGTLQDSGYVEYEFTGQRDGSVNIGIPQFTFLVKVTDVGNDDTIVVYKQQLLIDDEDSTSRVSFLNSYGMPTSSFGEGTNKMYMSWVTGSRQTVFTNTPHTYRLRLYVAGLHHGGNGLNIQLISDEVQLSYEYYFLTLANPGMNLRLSTTQGSATGITANLPWQPIVGPNSAIPGGSSKTFTNGYGIPSLGVQYYNQ